MRTANPDFFTINKNTSYGFFECTKYGFGCCSASCTDQTGKSKNFTATYLKRNVLN